MELAAVLTRVEQRLEALNLSANGASEMAGKPDAIRNMRRAVKDGNRQGVTTATIAALAPVLKVPLSWLLDGEGDQPEPHGVSDGRKIETGKRITVDRELLERAVSSVLRSRGMPQLHADLAGTILVEVLLEPPIPELADNPLRSFEVQFDLLTRRSFDPPPK